MCGPSSEETGLQAQTQAFSTVLQNNYNTLFGKQQNVLDSINRSLSPIVAAGPSQEGFSGRETAALQTRAIEQAGAGARAAEQAARTFGAGEGGGGTSGLTSGISKQIQSAIASQQAGALGKNLTDISLASEQQGRENYWRAQGGLAQMAAQLSPTSTGGLAGQEAGESFQQAQAIQQQRNALGQDIAGFATAAIGSAGDIYKAFKGG